MYIHEFTFMINVVCEKNRMSWIIPTAYKQLPVQIIRFILKIFNNEQHPFKHVRVD